MTMFFKANNGVIINYFKRPPSSLLHENGTKNRVDLRVNGNEVFPNYR